MHRKRTPFRSIKITVKTPFLGCFFMPFLCFFLERKGVDYGGDRIQTDSDENTVGQGNEKRRFYDETIDLCIIICIDGRFSGCLWKFR